MADSGDILNQQHLCRMFSSKFSGVNRLEMSPFLAVMRSLKLEYGQTHPEVFKMLLSVLHDYNPCLGQAHFDMTSRYIGLLLERHPEFAEYIISVLPTVPGNNTSTSPHSLHILRDDISTMHNNVMAGRNDFTAPKEASMVKGHSDQEEHPVAVKRMRVKDGNIKFYNYTPPSVNAYVASQGIPQRIISNKQQSVLPAMVTLATSPQVGLISSVAPSTVPGSTVAHPFLPIPSGGGVLLRPIGGGGSAGGLRVRAPSSVVGAHCQTALLLSTRCPTLIAPRSSDMSLASMVNPSQVSTNGLIPNPTSEIRKGVPSSQTAPKSSVITHMSGTTPVNTSVTVAFGRPSSVKFKASSLERNTASFPYSQQIVVNQLANVKHMSTGEPQSAVSRSEKILATVDAQNPVVASSDAQKSGKIAIAHNTNLVPVPTFTAYHSLCYPGSQSINETSGEPALRNKPDGLNIPELVGSLNVEPLDLSMMPASAQLDQIKIASKRAVDCWEEADLEEFSASEPNSQEDYDSQGTDSISVGGNSPAAVTMTTADGLSSEDHESDTFLAQILKLPRPPDYSSSWGVAPTKEKKKPKTRYYTGKRKRPLNQTKTST